MTPTQRSRRAELVDLLDTRAGVVSAMKDQAIDMLLMCNVAQSYCVTEHQVTALPRFWNAAGRALKQYLDAMPDDSEVLDLAEHVKLAMGDNGDDS
jgi:hypothetical protein